MFKDDIAAIIRDVSELQTSIEAMPLTEQEMSLMANVAVERKKVLELLAKIRTLKASDPAVVQTEMTQNCDPAVAVYLKALGVFAAEQERAKQALQAEVAERRAGTVRYAVMFNAIIVVGLIAAGHLSTHVPAGRHNEFGLLLGAMDRMVLRLRSVVGEVRQGAESGAHLVAQTGSAMEDIVASVKRVTDLIGEIASAATPRVHAPAPSVRPASGKTASKTSPSKRVSASALAAPRPAPAPTPVVASTPRTNAFQGASDEWESF